MYQHGKVADAYHSEVNENTQIKVSFKKLLSSCKSKDKPMVHLVKKTLTHFDKC